MKEMIKSELYTIKEVSSRFPFKNLRAFKYQLKKLQNQHPKDKLLKQVYFSESDVKLLMDKFRSIKAK